MIAAVLALLFLALAAVLTAVTPTRRPLAAAALLLAAASALPMHAPCTFAAAALVVADGLRVEAALPLLVAAGVGLAALAAPGAATAIAGALALLLVARVVRDALARKPRAHALVESGARAALALAVATELAEGHRLAYATRTVALALASALGIVAIAVGANAHASYAQRRLAARQRRARQERGLVREPPRTAGSPAASSGLAQATSAHATAHAALAEALKRIVHELRQPVGAASNALATARLAATEGALADDLRALAASELGAALEALEILARLSRVGVGERLRLPATDALTIALGAHADAVRFVPGFDGPLEVDPAQLSYALDALVRNARDACEDGPIHVETSLESGRLLVRVIDAGPPPSAEPLARAVEPFYTTRAGRLGIGATHAAAFARAMGGTLELRREGLYTVAELALPLAQP